MYIFFYPLLVVIWRMGLAPPSSVLRLNPSVWVPKEDDNLRSPFQAIVPCDLSMLPWRLFARRNLIV